ncbi:MAG: putative pterin-4-alpha-carbinolamine dehydratase [Lysobacterales bacterium]|jgi:4a-hydroxytetrahydrobiopterin dehydratase|nr:MAG: putative pterin-4-alpha-carbinolamine dehydratase [Xanthomonadales bacterium]
MRTLSDLLNARCRPRRPDTDRLDADRIEALLALLPGWTREGAGIAKTFRFPDYHRTMAFVNAVAWIAHREDHHPDLTVSYASCRVYFSTHDTGGLSENDFICAAKVEALLGG